MEAKYGTYVCKYCRTVLNYTQSDIRKKPERFFRGYLEDEWGISNYLHCPCCGKDNEISYDTRSVWNSSANMRPLF